MNDIQQQNEDGTWGPAEQWSPGDKPWYYDGDKVAAIVTTIIMVTVVLIGCTLLLIGTLKLAQVTL
jgi:hypothetical protein